MLVGFVGVVLLFWCFWLGLVDVGCLVVLCVWFSFVWIVLLVFYCCCFCLVIVLFGTGVICFD